MDRYHSVDFCHPSSARTVCDEAVPYVHLLRGINVVRPMSPQHQRLGNTADSEEPKTGETLRSVGGTLTIVQYWRAEPHVS